MVNAIDFFLRMQYNFCCHYFQERKRPNMKWGFFTPQHILSLVLAAAMLDGLYLWIRNKSPKFQTGVLFALSLSGVAAIV